MISHRRTFLKQLGFGVGALGLVSLPSSILAKGSLIQGKLPRSAPEAQGVRSEGILDFLKAIEASKHEFHSFIMVRHGHVIAEGWWSPYQPQLKHMLYSLSKSFTSTAVGLARAEGKLTVNDPVISFFPDKLPGEISDNLRALKIRDLLSMSVGHAQDSTPTITKEQDWGKAFLALPIANQPGSAFLYNSGATYMLSAIVQKVTGQKAIDFLKPRLFEPLEIEGMTWETCPMGINTGGWGLSLRTENLAKFGQVYLQKGSWGGRQILPSDWVDEATTFKIQQPGKDLEKLKIESDWHQGYCYQFWRCRHNGFRGDGAFGQFTIVLPDQDAVIAITSESPNMQGEMNLLWEHLLPAMQGQALPANHAAADELHQKLGGLALVAPKGQPASSTAARISHKPFAVSENELGLQGASFEFGKDKCVFKVRDAKAVHEVTCGLEKWISGQTTMPGTPPKLTVGAIPGPLKIAASGTWKDQQTFEMVWHFIETPHHDTVTCRFEGDEVKVETVDSLGHKDAKPRFNAKLQA